MARMLEVLSQTGPPARPAPEAQPSPPLPPPDPEGTQGQPEVEIPFIEVGGPRRIIEASPAVLACAPLARKLAPTPERKPEAPVTARPTTPRAVVLRPLPARALSAAPTERFAPELVAFHHPEDPVSQGYRALASAVSARRPGAGGQVVALTGAAPGVGATAVLLNLAITAARRGEGRVIVVDANGRRPAVAQRLGLAAGPGLCDALAGRVLPVEALQETGQENLSALAAGKADADRSVRLVAEAMPPVLRQLREHGALVLVDLPSWTEAENAPLLGSVCDLLFLVVPQSDADAPGVRELLQAIAGHGARLAGCILVQG